MKASSRSLPLVALVLGVAVLVVQIQVIAGGHTWDDVRYHTEIAPPRLAAGEAVQRGEVPGWWDGSGLGVTLAGEPSHGALYPLHWIAATPRALDLVLVVHLAWAALGIAVWARRRASDPGALVAAVLAVTAGVVASSALRGALPGLAHLPWLGAAVGWLTEAEGRRARARAACAIGGLVGAIALAGELAVLVDAVALALVLGLGRDTARPLAAALATGLAVGALQWLPAILQLPHGAGAQISALPLARLVELVVPGAFGAGQADRAIAAIAGATPWAPSVFVGAPLLALATLRTPSRRMLGVIGGLVVAALAWGRGGWPAWLGAPELHVAALALVLAVPAAEGLEALARGDRRAVLALGAGAGFTALALGALVMLRGRDPAPSAAIDRALVDGALGLACVLGAVVLAWRAPGRLGALLFALLVAPSAGATHATAPTVARALVSEPPPWARLLEHVPPPVRVFRPVFLYDQGGLDDAIPTFAGASAWRWGIAGARSADPARSQAHDRTWLAAAGDGGALLDRYGVSVAILPSTLLVPRKLTALGRRVSWALVELPAAPVASVMHGWRWARDPGDALELLFPAGGGAGLPRGTIVLAGAGEAGPSATEPRPCAVRAWRAGELELSCVAATAGYAVVSSSAAPGWSVSVDDRGEDWLAADVVRRAVAVPAGTHRVRWTYAVPGLGIGALAALAGALGLCALGWSGRRVQRAPGELVS